MLPHFNAELDRIRGAGTERQLAARLGISTDVLTRYRRGQFPRIVGRFAYFPALFTALARDHMRLATRRSRRKR